MGPPQTREVDVMESKNSSRQVEAVVDVTKPAFEGIETMTASEVAALGASVAEVFLEDCGYEAERCDGSAVFDFIAEGGEDTVAVRVASRRALGSMPGEIDVPESIDFWGIADNARRLAEELGERVRYDLVCITFLSNRIAHINHLQGCFVGAPSAGEGER